MWSPTSLNQTRLQPDPALWKPTPSRTSSAGLPGWQSLPALERRQLIQALVQTARRHVREYPMPSAEASAEMRA
jgi:hypothetical protein